MKLKNFDEYLDKIGAERIDLKSEWEEQRFKANGIVCIVYKNKKDTYSYSNKIAQDVYEAFLDGRPINIQTTKRKQFKEYFKEKLFKRDGNKCFYTGVELTIETATVEHLIPISKGGKNNMDNLVLCTKESNQTMSDKPLLEKIKFRESHVLKHF